MVHNYKPGIGLRDIISAPSGAPRSFHFAISSGFSRAVLFLLLVAVLATWTQVWAKTSTHPRRAPTTRGRSTNASRANLPDTVVARLPHRDVTVRELEKLWFGIDPRFRPEGRGDSLRGVFLEQVLDKEAVGRAALREPFIMTDRESASYRKLRQDRLAFALYKQLVLDSLKAADPGRKEESRRWLELRKNVLDAAQPMWDDSVVVLIANGFSSMPKPTEKNLGDVRVSVSSGVPSFAPTDTGRVVVSTREDRMTVANFLSRLQALGTTQGPEKVEPHQVRNQVEEFLISSWLVRESLRRGLDASPEVVEPLFRMREGFAVDHYYDRHIAPVVDTSEAVVRARFDRDPGHFGEAAYYMTQGTPVPSRGAADSARAAAASGASWDSVCAGLPISEEERKTCRVMRILRLDYDPAVLAALDSLPPGGVAYLPVPAMPDRGVLWRLERKVPARPRTYEEARPIVVRTLVSEQSEARVRSLIRSLRARMTVARNPRALAAVRLQTLGPENPER